MIVPDYWGEAKLKEKLPQGTRTIVRFGWSKLSQDEADKHALERAEEAMNRARMGEEVRPRDHKWSYNGLEGLPIREEVVERHDDIAITRNSYGSLCLNTPDVLFVDIDINDKPSTKLTWLMFLLLSAPGVIATKLYSEPLILWATILAAMYFCKDVAAMFHNARVKSKGGRETIMIDTIKKYLSIHRQSLLRLYRTPAGYRLLAMHQPFAPKGEQAKEIFEFFSCDPIYQHLCINQNCFRARVSPKPWRLNLQALRSGSWPVDGTKLQLRQQWITDYEKQASGYSACAFIGEFGYGAAHAKCEQVRYLHDRLSQTGKNQPIA